MSASSAVQPSLDTWVAAVHSSAHDFNPLGTAVVVGVDLVLTCAHVVVAEAAVVEPLWVAFPKAGDCPRRRVASVHVVYSRPVRDLAVLMLAEPVPAGVEAAPLRCPQGEDLVSRKWWAFGFPDRDPVGDCADGLVGASLSYGWVRLDTGSRYLIRPGFSGGGLWSPDYEAVVGIIGQAHANGDGRAITLRQADLDFPGLRLAELTRWSVETAGEIALAQWGWTLARDPEGVRHWRPRARGVSIDSERGWRFRGRTAALRKIVAWLDRAVLDRRVLVVTGSPGVGKSAVLGRIVTTADPDIRALLPSADEAVQASLGSVSCAVHAKGKTALEVAGEIARAASAALPGEPRDLAPAIRETLSQRGGARFNVIIDALDEAASPGQVRAIIDSVVLPLAETCSVTGAQVIVGTRRRDDGGDLLGRFGAALERVDLDDPGYFAGQDLAAYALACLQLAGDERPDNPYSDQTVAGPLAAQIAAMSGQNFLIAGLIGRSHGLHDEKAATAGQLEPPATVDSALAAYLERVRPVAGLPAAHALTALAFAEAPGFSAALWRLAVEAIYGVHLSIEDLIGFARSSAANFLVESAADVPSDADGGDAWPVYRLFHQALNDALLHTRADITVRTNDERSLAQAFIKHGRLTRWQKAGRYLLRSLPGHAQAAGLIDDLLTDDAYLLHADLRRLMPAAERSASMEARRRARLLQLTPQAITALPGERAALFSVTEALDELGNAYRAGAWEAPYRALWAVVRPRSERAALEGHQGRVNGVCEVTVSGRSLLASGGADGTVRVWDPATGQQRAVLQGHHGWVEAICAVSVGGQPLLASAGTDGTVRIWDPATGQQRAVLQGHHGWVEAICAVSVGGQPLLASAGTDGTVRIWDPATGQQRASLQGHQGGVNGVCPVSVGGQLLLASAGADGTIRIWDPTTGQQRASLQGHQGGARAVCPVSVGGQPLLASAGADGTIRIWDPAAGQQRAVLQGHQGGVNGVCAVTVGGQLLLASAETDGPLRIWDPATGQQRASLQGHQGGVRAVCAVGLSGQAMLASAGADGTVRIWDPAAGSRQAAALQGHHGGVNGMCAASVGGQPLLATAGADGMVRIWDPATGQQRAILQGHQGGVKAVCEITVDSQPLLASAGTDGTVRIWDLVTGQQRVALQDDQGGVRAVCVVSVADRPLLASAGAGHTVRIWDVAAGSEHTTSLKGRLGGVRAMCAVTVGGQARLASAGADGTVRIWDPATGSQRTLGLEGHRSGVKAVCTVSVGGQPLLASAGDDGTIRIWDTATGQQRATLQGRLGGVTAVCAVSIGGQPLLASASNDRTVRIWDPRVGVCVLTVPTYRAASAVAWVADSLAIGLNTGVLVIKPSPVI